MSDETAAAKALREDYGDRAVGLAQQLIAEERARLCAGVSPLTMTAAEEAAHDEVIHEVLSDTPGEAHDSFNQATMAWRAEAIATRAALAAEREAHEKTREQRDRAYENERCTREACAGFLED